MKVTKKILPLCLGIALIVGGCQKAPELATGQIAKPVNVQVAKVETKPNQLTYVGLMKAETIKKLGFSVGGRLSSVSVKKGDFVKKGQSLAVLEKEKYQIGVDASQAQLNAALSSLNKANEALSYAQTQLDKAKALYTEGSISKSAYDDAVLSHKLSQNDQQAAAAQVEQARSGLDNSQSTMTDTTLKADFEGKVVDVLYEKGEVVAAGYPVIVLQNADQIFSFGVSQKDYKAIQIGTSVEVRLADEKIKGKITNISDTPDESTRTYEVQVAIEPTNMPLGTIGEVYVPNGSVSGVTLPLNVILTGEYDFVFVVQEGKAIKKQVEILQVKDNYATVKGLSDKDSVITSGLKNLENADEVQVK